MSVASVAIGGSNNNKEIIFTNRVLFTDCISELNNALMDYTKHIDNLLEYSDHYSKTLVRLWQYYKQALVNGATADFPTTNNNNSALFKFKQKLKGKTRDTKLVQKMLKWYKRC